MVKDHRKSISLISDFLPAANREAKQTHPSNLTSSSDMENGVTAKKKRPHHGDAAPFLKIYDTSVFI